LISNERNSNTSTAAQQSSAGSPRRKLSYPNKVERAYQAGVRRVRAKRKAAGEPEIYSLGGPELSAACSRIPSAAHNDRWGDWVFDANRFALTYEPVNAPGWYELDLKRMTEPARMLDSILQFRNKVWASSKAAGDLVEALDDLLSPQSTLCSWGQAKTLNATKHLEELTATKFRPDRLNTESAVGAFRFLN